jgi:hypothetical protein
MEIQPGCPSSRKGVPPPWSSPGFQVAVHVGNGDRALAHAGATRLTDPRPVVAVRSRQALGLALYRNLVPNVQACCQASWASLEPLMPWEKPG